MYVTTPKPSLEAIGSYYQSEDYVSHTDRKKGVLENVYALVKRFTLSRKQKLISHITPSKGKLLDIGAGTGDFLSHCKIKGWEVVGTEPNESARELAKTKGVAVQKSIEEISGSFDIITLWHVLEHVYDLEDQINWLAKRLKENGRLLVAVPNYNSYDAKHYNEFWAAYDVPRHLYHFSQFSIKRLFENVNMEIEKVIPMKFDAYYVSLLSEKYKSGKMNYFKAFYMGWKSNLKAQTTNEYSSLIYILKHQ